MTHHASINSRFEDKTKNHDLNSRTQRTTLVSIVIQNSKQ